MIEFRTEGTKDDGSPKNVMYEPNSNNKHIHYPRPEQGGGSRQQSQNTAQQTSLPIDRIVEDPSTQRMQPDAPVHKPVVQPTPIPKTYETNADGSPKSWIQECDVCKQKGAPGQMIYGNAVGFDTTTQKYVWMIFDHDPANPAQHKVIHVHREKPKEVAKPPAVETTTKEGPPGLSPAELIAVMKAGQEQREKEQAFISTHAEKMLKTAQLNLTNNEMYMKAIIRVINHKMNQLSTVIAAAFMTEHPELADTFISNVGRLHAKDRETHELEFATDAVIFDALNIYDMRAAATPVTADKLIPTTLTPEPYGTNVPVPGLCTNCGTNVPDINNHTCAPLEEFKATPEELADIQAAEDETPDIDVVDDRVYRV